MPLQGCYTYDASARLKWDALNQTSPLSTLRMSFQMGNGTQLSSQISSLVALHLGKSPVSAKELPRGLEIFHVVSKPHGSSAILPVAVTLGCCREGEVVISSSVLLQGALDNTARWIFTRVFLKLKLFKKPPGKCSAYPISWSPREEGGRSKPQMWDQISVLPRKRPASFTECVF